MGMECAHCIYCLLPNRFKYKTKREEATQQAEVDGGRISFGIFDQKRPKIQFQNSQ